MVEVKFLSLHADAIVPEYADLFSSGADLFSLEDRVLQAGQRHLFKCGFAIGLPKGYEAQVRAKSGRSLKEGLTIVNGIGTIDEAYTYELAVMLLNTSTYDGAPAFIKKGQKIAQLVVAPYVQAKFVVVDSLTETVRTGGFGSSGLEKKAG